TGDPGIPLVLHLRLRLLALLQAVGEEQHAIVGGGQHLAIGASGFGTAGSRRSPAAAALLASAAAAAGPFTQAVCSRKGDSMIRPVGSRMRITRPSPRMVQ